MKSYKMEDVLAGKADYSKPTITPDIASGDYNPQTDSYWLGGNENYAPLPGPGEVQFYDPNKEKATKEVAIGIGGAPTRASSFPADAAERKQYPVASGVLDYFPDALVAVAQVSWRGNEQHNAGKPLHWNRAKSGDEGDALIRHFLQRGSLDDDGVRHSAKVAWRALALLQKEIEAASR
jgi:hypothetical protein